MKDKLTSLLDFVSDGDCDHVWEQKNAWSVANDIVVEDTTLVVRAGTIAHEKCGKCGRERKTKVGQARLELDAEFSDYKTYDNPFVLEEWDNAGTE